MKNICFKSVEDFYEEARVGIDFEYNDIWYSIEFNDPFFGEGDMRIHEQDAPNVFTYFDDSKCVEYHSLFDLVHNYKIGERTLAEIICDENGISRSVLPVENTAKTTREWFNEINGGTNGKNA